MMSDWTPQPYPINDYDLKELKAFSRHSLLDFAFLMFGLPKGPNDTSFSLNSSIVDTFTQTTTPSATLPRTPTPTPIL